MGGGISLKWNTFLTAVSLGFYFYFGAYENSTFLFLCTLIWEGCSSYRVWIHFLSDHWTVSEPSSPSLLILYAPLKYNTNCKNGAAHLFCGPAVRSITPLCGQCINGVQLVVFNSYHSTSKHLWGYTCTQYMHSISVWVLTPVLMKSGNQLCQVMTWQRAASAPNSVALQSAPRRLSASVQCEQ